MRQRDRSAMLKIIKILILSYEGVGIKAIADDCKVSDSYVSKIALQAGMGRHGADSIKVQRRIGDYYRHLNSGLNQKQIAEKLGITADHLKLFKKRYIKR